MISRLLLTARTAATLRPRQAVARLRRTTRRVLGRPRLRPPPRPPTLHPEVEGLAGPLASRLASPAFAPLIERARALRDGTLQAVGEALPVESLTWTGRPRNHLFSYHAHYFDDAPALALLARDGDGAAGARLRTLWEGWLRGCGGGERKGGGDGWDPYPIASRIPNWIQALALLGPSILDPPVLDPSLRGRLLSSLWSQADRLRRTLEHDLAGNHLLRNRTALVWAAAALDPPPVDPGRAVADLTRELERQVLADGMHEERTPAYHALALQDVLHVIEMLRSVDVTVPPSLESCAREMGRALGLFVRADGGLHPFGDTTPHGPPSGAMVERLAADILAPDVAGLPGPTGSEPSRTDGPRVTDGPGEARSWHLEEAGFAGVRGGTIEVALDCGPFGARHQPGHGHCDGLSFVLSVRGTPFVVDPGIAGYADDPHRPWARSTAAHNTVQVDGREQTEIWDTFRAARRARPGPAGVVPDDGGVRIFGALSPYHARDVVHERELIVGEAEVEVRDRVRGARGRRLDTRLHLARGATVHDVDLREGGVHGAGPREGGVHGVGLPGAGEYRWEVRCGGETVEVEVTGVDGARWETGLRFPGWGTVDEGPVLHAWLDAAARDVRDFGFRLRLRRSGDT